MRNTSSRVLSSLGVSSAVVVLATMTVVLAPASQAGVAHPAGLTFTVLPPPTVTAAPTTAPPSRPAGQLWDWGYGRYGALGVAPIGAEVEKPQRVPTLKSVTSVAADQYAGVAATSNGRVWTWGGDEGGMLGDGQASGQRALPGTVAGPTGVVAVAAGDNTRYAVTASGRVWGWGDNFDGQLCLGDRTERDTPVLIPGVFDVTAVATSGMTTYLLKRNGTVWGCGEGMFGQLGHGVTTRTLSPVVVPFGKQVTSIALNLDVGYAVIGGRVWAMGNNEWGMLGNGQEGYTRQDTPALVPKLSGVSRLAVEFTEGLALLTSGTVAYWGDAAPGRLAASVPVLTKATAIAVDSLYPSGFYAVQDGHIWQWGDGTSTALGAPYDSETPAEVPSPVGVFDLGNGYQSAFALSK
jgi:alpha-tubulin suppressor-like RCC1 family protein